MLEMSGSSLKFFAEAKNVVTVVVTEFLSLLLESRAFVAEFCEADELLFTQSESESFQKFVEKVQGILDILKRNSMKVAFFGRTSNGKSTVINAMMKSKILPSGIGHTTNCFVQVEGVDGDDAYVMTESGERRSVQSLSQLASALSKVSLSPESLIRIFWPKHKCHLLQEDVVLVDSPGIDLSADVDHWIDKFCLDADVFVLVINAESTLMQTEKNFFHRVSSRLSKPNIFILNNRWDASANELDTKKEVRQQHLDRSTSFLVDELQVMKPGDIEKRVFFISALETLQRSSNATYPDVTQYHLSNGMEERMNEFLYFEKCFEECISKTAVQTKFAQHVSNVESVANSMVNLWENIIIKTDQIRREKEKNLAEIRHQLSLIDDEFGRCLDNMNAVVSETSFQLKEKMTKLLTRELRHLHNILDDYDKVFNPDDQEIMKLYKKELNFYVEENLTKILHVKHTPVARTMFLDTCHNMIEAAGFLVPESEKQQMISLMPERNFELVYNLDCTGLCSNFIEDIEFRFSFGLSALLAKYQGSNRAEEFELTQLLASSINTSSLSPSTSSSTIGALALLSVVTKMIGFRAIAMCLVIYGLLYTYEKITWTTKAKEQTFKRQYIAFVSHQLRTVIDVISSNCSQQIERELKALLKEIYEVLVAHQKSLINSIQESEKSLEQMNRISVAAHEFRDNFRDVSRKLEEFRLKYLDA